MDLRNYISFEFKWKWPFKDYTCCYTNNGFVIIQTTVLLLMVLEAKIKYGNGVLIHKLSK